MENDHSDTEWKTLEFRTRTEEVPRLLLEEAGCCHRGLTRPTNGVVGNGKRRKKESDLTSLEDLMNEYSSLPPQIAEWFWTYEYVANFVKDLRCILGLTNMGYPSTNDYGSRICEVLSLRILEFLFSPTKIDPKIPLSELRPGLPELSTFNVLPFIAHKNMSLPLCALEKLRDVRSAMENHTSAAPNVEPNDPVYRDDHNQSGWMFARRWRQMSSKRLLLAWKKTSINDKDKVVVIDDADDRVQTK